ncbi:MAG: hypothetical protein ACFFDN_45405 [Candidatus Hodarchaeota archaeon]
MQKNNIKEQPSLESLLALYKENKQKIIDLVEERNRLQKQLESNDLND